MAHNNGPDLINEYTHTLSVNPDNYTATATGTGVDCNDHAEVYAELLIGDNPGDDTTITGVVQESADDSTYAATSPATAFTVVSGDTEDQTEVIRVNRSERYVRVLLTVAGTSPVIDMAAKIIAKKQSY